MQTKSKSLSAVSDGILGARAMARCEYLGDPPFSEAQGQLVRRFLTPAHAATLKAVGDWMAEAGMSVRLDETANLIGRYEGAVPGAPALMIGSHIDSVGNAGRFDGPLGVMLGIDCVEALSRAGRRPHIALEVVAFGDEEGSRFPTAMTCSRAVAGAADPATLEMRDADGHSLAEAFTAFGLPATDPSAAARRPRDILAYLEAHIEQGPVLEAEGLALGVVSAIAAQKRLTVRLTGTAGHAGTTPMRLRKDPGPAAAEAILAIERICATGDASLVGTVGRIAATPGSANVIPGALEFSIDLRAETSRARDSALTQVVAEIERIAERRGLGLSIQVLQDLLASPCDPALSAMLEAAVGSVGQPARRLTSGAGHDAMVMAELCPTAMLFIRCRGGISHNPAEAVEAADCVLAVQAMSAFIERLDAAYRAERIQPPAKKTP